MKMNNYKIKSRIWIEMDQQVILGEGRVRLLRAIEQNGSLSKAARCLELSYRKAWLQVEAMNRAAPSPLVITTTGGRNGGGTRLTAYGLEMVEAFEKIKQNCWEFLEGQQLEFPNSENPTA